MQKVYKVEPEMNRDEILCTTYQMRNFYRQMGDGFFSVLDTMNYIQHHQIVKWCRGGSHVLDICCGRGLLLPMLRYQRKNLGSYTGVDIEPRNAIWQTKRVTDNKPIEEDYYPFSTIFIESNVAEMASKLLPKKYDILIYTSSIEHMHKDMGRQSLFECRKVAKQNGIMIITAPNTPETQDGYDTQYAAHVYEWKQSEMIKGLREAGFEIISKWGLLIDNKILKDEMKKIGLERLYNHTKKYIPSEWYIPVFATMFPDQSKEIGFIVKAV